MVSKTLYSSKSDEWATPEEVFDSLNKEFSFTLNPCSTEKNHKCETYYTREQDGLKMPWGGTACSAIHLIQTSVRG